MEQAKTQTPTFHFVTFVFKNIMNTGVKCGVMRMDVIKSWSSVFDRWRGKGHDLSFAAWKADEWEKRNGKHSNRSTDNDRTVRDSSDNLDL